MAFDDQQAALEQRILSLIKNRFPISGKGLSIDVENLNVIRPKELGDIDGEYKLKIQKDSLMGRVKGTIVLKKNDKVIDSIPNTTIVKIPYRSLRGTYIVGGEDKVILNQLRSKPGPYTEYKGDTGVKTLIMFDNYSGPRIQMSLDAEKEKFTVSVQDKNFAGIQFLKFIGCADDEIRNAVGRDGFADRVIQNDKGPKGTIQDLFNLIVNHGRFNKTEFPINHDKAISMIQDALANNMTFGKDGEDVTEVNIGVKTSKFNKQAALATVKKTFDVARGNAQEDDRDDLIFQRVYSADDFITEYIDSDLDAFVKQAGKLLESGKVENTAYLATPLKRVGRSLADFMSTSSLVEDSEENNPIHLLSTLDKVTLLGKGGITGGALENAMKPRNLRKTGINRLDPVHTPESGNIGLVNHLTQDASIKEGTIFTKFYKVKDGKASTADNNIVELSPKDEYGSYVAFYDMRHLNRNNKELEFTTEFVPARYRGQLIEIDKDKIQYIDRAPQNIFDVATNLVPFGHHNDGNRMLMGANMQTQAVNIINREEPLVQVAADVDKKKTFEEVLGDKAFTVKSPVNGTVEDVKGNMISIKDDKGKTHEVKIYDYFPLNRNNFINNEPTVKVGDKVKKDQLIAEGWQTRNGKLALGLNARVAYMPFKGYNYEDGVVVSDKFAERMMTEELITDDVKIREDHVGGPGSSAKKLMLEYLSPQKSLDNLDDDGIIKEGTMVKSGDILVARLKKVSADTLDASRQLYARFSGQSERYRDASEYIPIGSYRAGKVTRVVVMSGSQAGDSEAKYVIKITIAMQKPLKFGDKIAGRHGNKGTITEILPESEMPKAPDGKPIEVIYSPLAIPSRKNPGQLYEVNAGLIAEKKNQPFKVVNFDPTAKDEVLDGLKEIGIPDGKMELIDPETGKPYDNPVTVGNMYIMKLKHKVDDKIQARSGIETQPNLKFMDPVKQIGTAAGEKHNPQTLGEMEMWVMQANKAVNNILEATTLKSDGAGDIKQRAAIFRALAGDMKFQDLDDFSSTPASLKILDDTLTSMGFKMTPLNNGNRVKSLDDTFGELMLSPMKADEMIKLIGKDNEVVNAKKFEAKPSEIDNPEPGGLYDTKIFGKAEEINDRNKWGYIKLTHPIPNPIFMKNSQYNPYSTLLTQFSSSELSKIMDDPNLVVITNPGDTGLKPNQLIKATEAEKLLYEEGKKFEWKVSGDAILHYLKQVDVNKELKETESALKRSKGSERDKLYAKYRVLKNLKVNNIKPEDLMLKVVPVSPVYMRPMIRMGKNVLRNDLTTLYSDVIIQNNASKETLGDPDSVTPYEASKDSTNLYKLVSNLFGATVGKDPYSGRELKGFQERLEHKEGLVRKRMLGKKVDYSGRAVIGVDPKLKLNEAGLPIDIAKTIYKPFIIKELVDTGKGNYDEANDAVKNMTSKEAKDALMKVMKDRPILLNRAPSLHKYSIQAFKPVLKEYNEDGSPIRTIQLNPLVVTGFNADFDGDQMAVHVPLTEKSKEEAKKLMMPSDNLMNPTNGTMIIDIRHEMLLGIYYLTMNSDKPSDKPVKQFSSYDELHKAYLNHDIGVRDMTTVQGKTATAGQLLFNLLLPETHRKWGVTMAKKPMRELLNELYNDSKIGKIELSNLIDRIKDLGFESATKSALSIGINDFKKNEDFDKNIDELTKKIDDDLKQNDQALIAAYSDLKDKIEDQFKKGKAFEPENPVQIMMGSGARGDAGQMRAMSVMVGPGRDILGNMTKPVKTSLLTGLSPEEYWLQSFDSRKGMADRVLNTAKPGTLSRQVWSAIEDTIVSEKDCGTTDGIWIPVGKAMYGRFLAKDLKGANNTIIARRGDVINKALYDAIAKNKTIKDVFVRSPLTCKSTTGICQMCYGTMPGTIDLPSLGEPVGVLATQALGEPVTQMTMNTFHAGASASSATLGLPRIQEILNTSNAPVNKAVLSKADGKVKIEHKDNEILIYVNDTVHSIKKDPNGQFKPLKVKDGDYVRKGDFLTVGDISDLYDPKYKDVGMTSAAPSELFKLTQEATGDPKKALERTQDYLVNSMDYAFNKTVGSGAIDRRHLEVQINKLTSMVKVVDGGSSNYMPGQTVERNEVDKWNAINASPLNPKTYPSREVKSILGCRSASMYRDKKGIIIREGEVINKDQLGRILLAGYKEVKIVPKPIKYEIEINSIGTVVAKGHDNWLSNLGYQNVNTQLARGAAFGQVDKLEDIRGRQMTGKLLNIGEGYSVWQKVKDKANSFANSLMNMFK